LSFDFHTSSRVGIADSIAVEISPDGGANFIILDTIDWIDGAVFDTRVYDITPFATPETVIRIRVEQFYGLDGKEFYADNIQVSYTFGPEVPRCNVQTVADGFQAYPYTYENNSGTRNWLTPWVEVGEKDGPVSGDVSIINSNELGRALKIWETYTDSSWDAVDGVWRTADLSGASSARLSFLYSRSSMTADDYVSVEASTDGGATWEEVGRVAGGGTSNVSTSDEGWRYAEFDLSNFISTNTGIRLASNYVHDDYWDNFYISDVKITFDDPCSDMPPSTYLETLGVPQVWGMGIDGSGITVAVVDSGIAMDDDFGAVPGESGSERLSLQLGFNSSAYTRQDVYGHGTHVAGIIGGNGTKSDGYYKGVAPGVDLISIKISDDYGMAYESDVVAAMQWIYENKATYNIRVVNISLNSTQSDSYHNSPMNAAAEILWFNGVVVVVSAGNSEPNQTYDTINSAPANDPFVITVGAADEKGTSNRNDDVATSFSAWGNTYDGHLKPDIYAPGKNIVSVLAASSWWRNDHPDRFVDGGYFNISGTSMAAPMVTGAVALLLQAEPDLNPDQVKYRLTYTAGYVSAWKYLDVYALLTTPTTEPANSGQLPSLLLATGEDAIDFTSVGWNSVGWNSVGWNSVGWNSVGWNSVGWNSVGWNSVGWNSTFWGE
jgi:serine protease AprX